jgi:hypothetical protein
LGCFEGCHLGCLCLSIPCRLRLSIPCCLCLSIPCRLCLSIGAHLTAIFLGPNLARAPEPLLPQLAAACIILKCQISAAMA